jgi:hypothetical protein
MTRDEINKAFDRQIKRDNKFYVHKQLFNLTYNFNIEDWRKIRDSEYWQTIDSLSYDDKKKFTLICVKKYLKK